MTKDSVVLDAILAQAILAQEFFSGGDVLGAQCRNFLTVRMPSSDPRAVALSSRESWGDQIHHSCSISAALSISWLHCTTAHRVSCAFLL